MQYSNHSAKIKVKLDEWQHTHSSYLASTLVLPLTTVLESKHQQRRQALLLPKLGSNPRSPASHGGCETGYSMMLMAAQRIALYVARHGQQLTHASMVHACKAAEHGACILPFIWSVRHKLQATNSG